VDEVKSAVERASLDADDDGEVINALLTAAETLNEDLDAAEEWSDLTVQEQFDAEGFYDVLDAENRKDYPPEWNAVKIYAKQNEPEPILTALERLESDFMEENILEVLKRMAPGEAYDAVHQRAQKRNTVAVEILGKIGDERALETLHGYIDGSGDAKLQQVSLRAIGEIGSEESTQPVANRLDAENPDVRSAAARSLGLLGDTRAIEPLSTVLEDDAVDTVRASAAWALNQIGTERALEQLTDYTDDTAYIVQAEAQKAT
jgi:HEAT repeat protein